MATIAESERPFQMFAEGKSKKKKKRNKKKKKAGNGSMCLRHGERQKIGTVHDFQSAIAEERERKAMLIKPSESAKEENEKEKEKEDVTTAVPQLPKVENTEKGSKIDDVIMPDLIFISEFKSKHGTLVTPYLLDTRDLSMNPLMILKPRDIFGNLGYATSGSKLYALGGSFVVEDGNYPLDFFILDLSYWTKRRRNSNSDAHFDGFFEWEKGPQLKGGKPMPVVVALHGKIYALSGYTGGHDKSQVPDPVFEVFDTEKAVWEPLPNPPFYDLYLSHSGPFIRNPVVIGNTFYIEVAHFYVNSFYAYNVSNGSWKNVEEGGGNEDLIIDNLIKCYRECWPWAEIAYDMMFLCTDGTGYRGAVQAYAYDLAAKLEEPPPPPAKNEEEEGLKDFSSAIPPPTNYEEVDDSSSTVTEVEVIDIDSDELLSLSSSSDEAAAYSVSFDSDTVPILPQGPCVTLPMHGLDSVMSRIPGNITNEGLIAHLVDDVFCLVYFFFTPGGSKPCARACTFSFVDDEGKPVFSGSGEASRTQPRHSFLQAKILRTASLPIAPNSGIPSHWCKI